MFRYAFLAAGLLASTTVISMAQDAPLPLPPQPPGAAEAPGEGVSGGMAERRGPPGRGRGHMGPMGGMMAGQPPDLMKGFDLRMGRDAGLLVECGDETMSDCVAAVRPLIDQLTGTPSASDDMPPPPPPGAPPPPGDAPVPGVTPPPPPPAN